MQSFFDNNIAIIQAFYFVHKGYQQNWPKFRIQKTFLLLLSTYIKSLMGKEEKEVKLVKLNLVHEKFIFMMFMSVSVTFTSK